MSEPFHQKSVNSTFVYRWFMFSGAGWSLMVFGTILSVIVWVTRPLETIQGWMLPIGILFLSLVGLLVFQFLAAQTTRTKRAHAEHGGKTCPFCLKNAWANRWCCSNFPKNWSPIDLERYWTDRGQSNVVAKSVKRGDPPEPLSLIARRPFGMLFFTISATVILLIAMVMIFLRYPLMAGTPLMLYVFILYIPAIPLIQALMMTNSDFWATGICSNCGHQQPPGNNEICSECGSKVDDSKVMPKLSTRSRLVCMVLGFAPLVLLLASQFFGPMIKAGAATNLSNTALIPFAAAQNGFDQWALDELMTRTLNKEEMDLVFEAAMNQRRNDEYFSSNRDLGPLVEQQILAGRLSPEQLKVLRVEGWKSDLLAPSVVEAGETFIVTLRGERREDFLTNNMGTTILFDGISINGGAFHGGLPHGLWTLQPESETDSSVLEFDVETSIDQPGISTLLIRYWVMDRQYSRMRDVVKRNEDGTPIQPLDSSWIYPVMIETNIEVHSAD